MTEVIALTNEKGGVGKTPTAINLAYALTRAGRRVLLVDIDPQASATKYFLDDDYLKLQLAIYDGLIKGTKIPTIQITEKLSLLPATNGQIPLTNAEIELPQKFRFDYQRRLKKLLQAYKEYDYIIIDTPGNVSLFTVLALAAANQVVIPVKTEKSAEQATGDIISVINQVKGTEEDPGLNPDLKIWGILPTLSEPRVLHHQQVIDILNDKYKGLVYPEPSKKSNEYNNAHVLKTDVSVRDPELGHYWDRIAASIIQGGF